MELYYSSQVMLIQESVSWISMDIPDQSGDSSQESFCVNPFSRARLKQPVEQEVSLINFGSSQTIGLQELVD